MKALIHHRPESEQSALTQSVDVFASTELSCCELAYFHTCANSMTTLMQTNVRPTDVGDIIELLDEDRPTPGRKFMIVAIKDGVPCFQRWH